MSMNATVTVGIPCYVGTQAEYFRASVDSILNQSFCPYEIHLIQDGPVSDDVEELIFSYVASHCYIKHLQVSANLGLPYALNFSILTTLTPYYARMDDDDIAHSGRLEKQVAFLEEHPEIDILGTWVCEFEENPYIESGFVKKLPATSDQIRAFFHYRNPLAHPSVMFRRSVFAKIGLYNVDFRTDQDLELWARALKMGIGMTNLSEVLLYHRMTDVIRKRSNLQRVLRQARARYKYNTWSVKLNILKIWALAFRLLPYSAREWGYRHLR